MNGTTLVREPLVSPQELGADTQTDLMYADPTEQLSLVAPPDPDSSGAAAVDYPIVLPKGRGMTPELAISYTSGGPSSWAGLGWDLAVGDVSVDTEFGVPLFCPRDVGPKCDDVESESYTLDGEALLPSAVRSSYLPRIADREDFTGRVETEYRRIIRHGDNTKDYFWEVVDKEGAIKWYGAYPDSGGPFGEGGGRAEPFRNDKAQDKSAILFDDEDNAVRWYLSAERDVGVNFFRYEYDTITYRASQQGQGTTWVALPDDDCPDGTVCAQHVYLSKILYTGVGEQDITPGEDPAYEIHFVRRETPRIDAVLDGTGGFLDLDRELLKDIEVRYADTGALITRYRLQYETGRFGKSLLTGVTQSGCTGGGKDDCAGDDQAASHTFTYFDDIGTAGSGFKTAQWDTRDDNLNKSRLVNRASALGMSAANGGDGQVYIGYNSVAPDKNGSFGGSITLEGATTESLLEFLDINGDGLPDKVFRDNPDLTGAGTIRYRLNTSSPCGGAGCSGDLRGRLACHRRPGRQDRPATGLPGVRGDRRHRGLLRGRRGLQRRRVLGLRRELLQRRQQRRSSGLRARHRGLLQPPRLLGRRGQPRRQGAVRPDVRQERREHAGSADGAVDPLGERRAGRRAAEAARARAPGRHRAPVGRAVHGSDQHRGHRDAARPTTG